MSDLTERLRVNAKSWRRKDAFQSREQNEEAKLCDEAADEIERLRSLATQHHQGGEVERLREALKPFARIADMEERAGPMDSVMVNVARCRDARAALAQQPLSVPAGWQLVPINPTAAMIEAGRMARMNVAGGYDGPGGWEAMLAVAPTVGGKEE